MGRILSKVLFEPYAGHLAFLCPACEEVHIVKIDGDNWWCWNSNAESPSFSPSIDVRYVRLTDQGKHMLDKGIPLPQGVKTYPHTNEVCHSWVTDGLITFYNDCTHKLTGQTVPLIPHGREQTNSE